MPTGKPDPAVYLHACRQAGIDPASGLAVEDSVVGAQCAVVAGVPTVGNLQFVQPGERAERQLGLREAGVRTVVASWGEFEDLLAPATRLSLRE